MKIDWAKFSVVSFFMGNISDEVRLYQAKVFERFGVPLQQIKLVVEGPMQESMIIGSAYEQYVELAKDKVEYFMFFDIDCIPLSKKAIEEYITQMKIMGKGQLIGPVQRSNHIENARHTFAAPCALGFSSELYKWVKERNPEVSI